MSIVQEFEQLRQRFGKVLTIDKYIQEKGLKLRQGQISSWKKQLSKLAANIKTSYGKKAKKIFDRRRCLPRFPAMEKELKQRIDQRRSLHRKVSSRWVRIQAKRIMKGIYCDEETQEWTDPKAARFKASKNWLSKFMLRNNYSLKKRTNKKLKDQGDAKERIQRFHSSFRHMLLTHTPTKNDGSPFESNGSVDAAPGGSVEAEAPPAPPVEVEDGLADVAVDDTAGITPAGYTAGFGATAAHLASKWGPYPPNRRAAVDQVPLPLVIDTLTWAAKGRGQVAVADAVNGMDKRFCTVQVIFFMDGRQPELAVIFRGTGKRISAEEKAAYADGIRVYWQKKVSNVFSWAHAFLHFTLNTSQPHTALYFFVPYLLLPVTGLGRPRFLC